MIFFIGNLFIPIIMYFQLLAQNLYPVLMAIGGKGGKVETGVDFSEFSYSYTCLIIMVLLLLITAIRNLNIFVKIATFGVIFVSLIIIFIVGVGIYGFTNTDYVYSDKDFKDHPGSSKILLANS